MLKSLTDTVIDEKSLLVSQTEVSLSWYNKEI
jgi:hypothetical protein